MAKNSHSDTGMEEIQERADTAFAKRAVAFGAYGALAKENVYAFLQAGQIFAHGLRHLGSSYSAESRTNLERLAEDFKGLAAATSPMEFYQLQSEFVRRNIETAITLGARNNEALLKLAKDTTAPLAKQADLTVEAIQKIA